MRSNNPRTGVGARCRCRRYSDKLARYDKDRLSGSVINETGIRLCVLKLAQSKIHHLDEPIASYLPEQLTRKEVRLTLATTRMLLSHTSGISGGLDAPTFNFTPGERFEYAPLGFRFLQLAVERLTGLSLSRFIQRNTF